MDTFAINLLSASSGFNWYGFIIGAGMVCCIIIAHFCAVRRGYNKDLVFDICIICIPLAIVGARLYYVIFSGETWTFKEIIGFGEGGLRGLAIYGGLIGAVLGAVIVALIKRKKPAKDKATFLQIADVGFSVIILGQAIGRWGNFANQEAYGNYISSSSAQWFPLGVFIDNCSQSGCGCNGAGGWHQATFFYESFFNFLGFALLMFLFNGKRKSFDGFILSVYCIWYGLVRFFIEGLRTDSLYIGSTNVRVSQVVSALIVLCGIALIIAHVYRARVKGKKPFIFVEQSKLDDSYFGYEQSILSHPNVYEKKDGFFKRLFTSKPTPEPVENVDNASDESNDNQTDYNELADKVLQDDALPEEKIGEVSSGGKVIYEDENLGDVNE